MKGLLIGLVLVILVIGGFFAFSGDESNVATGSDSAASGSAASEGNDDHDMDDMVDSSGNSEEAGATSTDSSGATTHEVDIISFKVPTLTIKVGDTVTWTNRDSAPHTATANGGSFDTDRLETGESGSFTFTSAGTFDYFCAIHPSMKGKIIVE